MSTRFIEHNFARGALKLFSAVSGYDDRLGERLNGGEKGEDRFEI